jgi:hypothetical protein
MLTKKKHNKKNKKTLNFNFRLINSNDILVTILCQEKIKTKSTQAFIVKEI